MANPNYPSDSVAPVASAVAVSKSDTVSFAPTRGLYVGVSGDVKVDHASSETVTYVGLASGILHPISVTRVYATGTTATNIVAGY